MMNLTENQLKALDFQRNIALIAGAGSGKTTVLVQRYLHILLQNPHLPVAGILAITFTEKAAAEMKERIFREIEQRFATESSPTAPSLQKRLFTIFQQLHQAQIFTIHAFCSRLIQQFPVESGINPDFLIMEEVQKTEFLERIFRDFFQQYGTEPGRTFPLERQALYAFPLSTIRKFLNLVYNQRAILEPFLNEVAERSPEEIQQRWEAQFVRLHRSVVQDFLQNRTLQEALRTLAHLNPAHPLSQLVHRLSQNQLNLSEQTRLVIEIILRLLKKDLTAYKRIDSRVWNGEGREIFREASQQAVAYARGLFPWDVHSNEEFAPIFIGLARIARDFLHFASEAKVRLNALDFEDLQIHAIRLLEQFPHIRKRLREQYRYVLVDEFQDTDALQSRLIELLTSEENSKIPPGKLFFVGDDKQSIYGFRYADLRIFRRFTERVQQQGGNRPFRNPNNGEELPASEAERKGVISLSHNFRSHPALIAFFNHFFREVLLPVSDYDVSFSPLQAARTDTAGLNSEIHLTVLTQTNSGETPPESLPQSEAQYVARLIRRIVAENPLQCQEATPRGTATRPLRYGDVAVLLRGRTHLDKLVEALRRQGIPHQVYKGKGFFQQREVQDLYYLLKTLAQPEDDFALLTFLRSELAGLSDETLFYLSQVQGSNYRERLQRLCQFLQQPGNLQNTFLPEFAQFLETQGESPHIPEAQQHALTYLNQKLEEWQPLALSSQFTLLLDTILEDLQVRALLAGQKDGAQKLANLDKFVRFVQEYQMSRSALLMDLLEALQSQMQREAPEGEATILEQEPDKVQILTYHSAKGMEFPVVILPFLNQRFQLTSRQSIFVDADWGFSVVPDFLRPPSSGITEGNSIRYEPFIHRWIKQQAEVRQLAEEKRLFYVATTRARDHLFLIGSLNRYNRVEESSYLHWLTERYQLSPLSAGEAHQEVPLEDGYRLHTHVLPAPEEEPSAQPEVPSASREEEWLPEHWLPFQHPIPEPPGYQVYSATQLMIFRENPRRYFQHFYLQDYRISAQPENLEYEDEPGGALWGSAVHKLLEDFPRRPASQDAPKIDWIVQHYFSAFPENWSQLRTRLQELMERVRSSELVRWLETAEQFSEFSVDLALEPFVLQGIFDRLFRNSRGVWEVLDFKTNRISRGEVPDTARKYRFQMEAYALLLAHLFPEQSHYPVTLYFLEPMQSVQIRFTPEELDGIRTRIRRLMEQLYRQEYELLYARGGISRIEQDGEENQEEMP